jgi:fibronectin type 3 domain-containing protein
MAIFTWRSSLSLRAHVDVRGRFKRSHLFLLFALAILDVVSGPSMSDAAQLTLTWVDNSGGQAAFSIERKTGSTGSYAEIAQQSVGVVSYVDTGVTAGTAYCYRLRAFNGAGTSPYSNEACGSPAGSFTVTVAKTGTGAGTVTSTPAGITCGADCSEPYVTGTLVTLSATPTTGSTFSGWSGGGCSGTAACSLAGNSAVTVTATFANAPTDTTAPLVPTALAASVIGSTQINLSWAPSTDNVGVSGYRLERCQGAGCSSFIQIAAPTGTSFGNTGLAAGTSYSYRVRATDAAGNLSGYSAVVSATTTSTSSGDTTAPSIPAGLTAVAFSSTKISLNWTASTDIVGVTGYRVERCQGIGCSSFVQIATPTGTTLRNNGLAPGTTYSYRVRATDGAGNLSGYSAVVAATTRDYGDTTSPSIPTALAASVMGSTQINLSWAPSTDNVGISGYRLERCQGVGCSSFAQIAAPTGTSHSNTGLAAGTSYSYRVRATDAAGNFSGYSTVATATTLANTSATTSGPYTIWSSASIPGLAADPDTNAVEIGVKFRSYSNGVITGIRFYKSTANTGTHVGNLWTSSGQLLASVTFTNETASGWQQANFSTPVPISANTIYVASYHTNVGRYAGDNNYFATSGVDTPPLQALPNSTTGGNGVYRYGSGGFPNQTYKASNYWVDVVFTIR